MTPWALLSFSTSLAKGAHKYGLDSVSILENLKALPQLVFILTLFQTDKLDAAELTEMTDFMAGVGYRATAMPPLDHLFVKI